MNKDMQALIGFGIWAVVAGSFLLWCWWLDHRTGGWIPKPPEPHQCKLPWRKRSGRIWRCFECGQRWEPYWTTHGVPGVVPLGEWRKVGE